MLVFKSLTTFENPLKHDKMCVYSTWFCSVKEVGVVGALPQLHEDVLQPHLLHLASAVDDVDVLHEDLGVPLPLHLGQSDIDVNLLLG